MTWSETQARRAEPGTVREACKACLGACSTGAVLANLEPLTDNVTGAALSPPPSPNALITLYCSSIYSGRCGAAEGAARPNPIHDVLGLPLLWASISDAPEK